MPDETVLPPSPAGAAPSPESVDEFAGIEPARRMRSPIVAALAALVAAYLLFHLRTDLAYWIHESSPIELGEARAVVGGLPPPNHYVSVSGMPDRASAALLDTRGRDEFRQFFRLLGTGSRLLVLRTFGSVPNARTLADRFAGRLVRFRDLSFGDSIAAWFRARQAVAHFLPPDGLRGHPAQVNDLAGDPVRLTPETRLSIDFSFPDQYLITLPRERYASAAAAETALRQVGLADLGPAPSPVSLPDPTSYYLYVGRPRAEMRDPVLHALGELRPPATVVADPVDPAWLWVAIPKAVYPQGVEQANRALAVMGFAAGLPPLLYHGRVTAAERDHVLERLSGLDRRILVVPRAETREITYGKLDPQTFGAARVDRVKVVEPLVIPEGAFVIVEGDAPRSYWYVPILAALLTAFFVFNLFALREALSWRSASSTR
jgi:hypothetical protein